MPICTTEIAGKATMAFAARDYADALAFVHVDFLRSEMRDLRALDGAPLWDGQAELVVRDATEEELAAWEADVAVAIREREIDRREDALDPGWFIFLVPYREPEE